MPSQGSACDPSPSRPFWAAFWLARIHDEPGSPGLRDRSSRLSGPPSRPIERRSWFAGRDIWTAPAAGGDARLLVCTMRLVGPLYSPDGDRLAFVRTDRRRHYVLTLRTGVLERTTVDDG